MRFKTRRGFTLLELSVALVLTGLMAGMYLTLSKSSNHAECYATTKRQTQTIKDAIERFAMKNDRFPIPAARNIGVEDVNYGREAGTVAQIVANAALPAIDEIDGALFGALPFQALGIPVENASDCWGNKYTYAMTKELADPAKFLNPDTVGKLKIKTNNTIVFLQETGYAIISHGADQLGAVKNNYSGTDKKWCTSDGTLKTQNCDVTNTDLVSTEYNDGKTAAADFFDDVIVYRGKPWRAGVVGNLYCWGMAGHAGNPPIRHRPKLVSPNLVLKKIVMGNNGGACGLDMNDRAYCGGPPGTLTALPGTLAAPGTPLQFSDIAVGVNSDFCGITKTDGHVYCWGFRPFGGVTNYANPTPLFGPLGTLAPGDVLAFKQVTMGHGPMSCGLTMAGRTYCWGFTGRTPIPVPGPDGTTNTFHTFKFINGRYGHICALDMSDKAYCWGSNVAGEAGNGAEGPGTENTFPQPVLGPQFPPIPPYSYSTIGTGTFYTCGMRTNKKVYCWGHALHNPLLHITSPSTVPVRLYPNVVAPDYQKLATGYDHACVLTMAGKAHCWGYNIRGQLGISTATFPGATGFTHPVVGPDGTVANALTFTDIASGMYATCGLVAP